MIEHIANLSGRLSTPTLVLWKKIFALFPEKILIRLSQRYRYQLGLSALEAKLTDEFSKISYTGKHLPISCCEFIGLRPMTFAVLSSLTKVGNERWQVKKPVQINLTRANF